MDKETSKLIKFIVDYMKDILKIYQKTDEENRSVLSGHLGDLIFNHVLDEAADDFKAILDEALAISVDSSKERKEEKKVATDEKEKGNKGMKGDKLGSLFDSCKQKNSIGENDESKDVLESNEITGRKRNRDGINSIVELMKGVLTFYQKLKDDYSVQLEDQLSDIIIDDDMYDLAYSFCWTFDEAIEYAQEKGQEELEEGDSDDKISPEPERKRSKVT